MVQFSQFWQKHQEITGLIHRYFFHALIQLTNMVLPVVTVPHLVVHLGLEGFGKYSYWVLISYYASLIPDFGFNQAAPIALMGKNEKERTSYFQSVLACRLLLALFVSCLMILCVGWFYGFSFLVCGGVVFWIFGAALNPTWFLQGDKQIQIISVYNLLTKILFTILVFAFINTPEHLQLLLFFWGTANLLNGGLGLYPLRKRLHGLASHISAKQVIETVISHLPYFKYLLNNNLLANSGGLILNHLQGSASLGFYSSYEKLNKGILSIFSPVSTALFPFFAQEFSKSKIRFRRWLLVAGISTIAFFSLLFLLANLFLEPVSLKLFHFFSPQAKLLFKAFSIWSLLGILNNFLGSQYLTITGQISAYNTIYFLGSLLFVGTAFTLIPQLGPLGLIYSMVIAEAAIGLAQAGVVLRSEIRG